MGPYVVATSTVTSGSGFVNYLTVSTPPQVQANDILVVYVASWSGSFTYPAGWTEQIQGVFTKVATASEPSSYTFSVVNGPAYLSLILLLVRGGSSSTPVDAKIATASATSPSVTTTAPNDLVLCGNFASSAQTASSSAALTVEATVDGGSQDDNWLQVVGFTQGAAGATPTVSWSPAYLGAWTLALFNPVAAPAAPTLTSPANASYADVSSGVSLTGTYNSTDGYTQNAYACRIKISGGSYSYYNAGTNALQSTIVWNSDSVANQGSFSAPIPSTAVSNGNTYNWSLASQESGANLQGPFATDFTFTSAATPTVVVNYPSGTETTTVAPTIEWTTSPGSGLSQTAYEVIVEHGAYGTTPGSGTQDWSSGVVSSAAQSATVGVNLSNSVTYRVFVQATETGGITSQWAYSTFTISLDAPAQPTVTATATTDPSTGCPMIEITVQGHDNLLSAADASFEGSIGTWLDRANCALADSSTEHLDGSDSLQMTASASGTMSAQTAASGYAVDAGTTYTALASFFPASTTRSVQVLIIWYSDTHGTILSTSTGTAVTETAAAWTQASLTVAAPTGAVAAAAVAQVVSAASSEIHYVDCAGLFPGTITAWTAGGFAGSSATVITRSDGLQVRNASAANPAPIPTPSQTAVVNDYEAVSGTAYTYSAIVQVVETGGTVAGSAGTSNAATLNNTKWWILDPTNPPSACAPQPTQWNPVQLQQATAHLVLGQNVANVVGSVTMNPDFNGTFELFDNNTYDAFEALLALGKAVFISSSAVPSDSGYYIIGPQSGGLSMGVGVRAKDTQLLPSTSAALHRTVAVTAVAAARPTV